MVNNLKIKKYWIATLCMVFCSLSSFAQDLSDATIGFDVARVTVSLKEHGVKDQDMAREISMMREEQIHQYQVMKKVKDDILQKIISEQNSKTSTARSSASNIPQSEKEALIALYNSTDGANWLNKTGWNVTDPDAIVSDWRGVGIQNGHVYSIGLNQNNLNGFIPSEIGQLPYLKYLNLNNNKLSGSIPHEIENLYNLQSLDLSRNKLNNSIPIELYSLIKLDHIDIGFNQLTGTLAPEIGLLKELQVFWVGNNQIEGPIPTEICQLSKLVSLYMGTNKLTGTIPVEIGQLSELSSLTLSTNQLTGNLPSELGNLKKLYDLVVHTNQLSGEIPTQIGNTSTLRYLLLNNNNFTGHIPDTFSNLINIQQFTVHNNNLDGELPQGLNTWSQIMIFNVSNNKFSGAVPNLTSSTILINMYLDKNKFRFVDFIDQYAYYKSKAFPFYFVPQAKIASPQTITRALGKTVTLKMFPDGDTRYHIGDTYQWFKNNQIINNATESSYTISNLTTSNEGQYICRSYHRTNPDMSELTLEREPITLQITNCTPTTGSITSDSDKFHTNAESTFAFESTATGLTYEWSVTPANGTATSNTLNSYTHTFADAGDYEVKVVATDSIGCTTTFTKLIKVEERYCDKEPIDFAFNTTETNLTYNWTSTDSLGNIVHRETNATGLYTFTPQVGGEYVIELVASNATSCKTLFSKNVIVDQCTPYISCTKDNPLSPEIHRLFINLIGKLASTPTGTDVNIYAHKEIAAVAPYTADLRAKIYNFTNTSEAVSFSFSATAAENEIYIPKSASGSITAINLEKYKDALTSTIVATSYTSGTTNKSDGHVRNIDFCPKELSCVSHIALVVDESGSLDASEINKIKKQLKLFVAQQAFTNDDIGSNIYVSITGMSDSDANTRTDFIYPRKMTAGNVGEFNAWIDKLGKRYGDKGVSQASDYWKSGLDGALAYTMKPTFVLMITDGAQTASVQGLKETLAKFDNNNKTVTVPKLPHLYVVGIENGNYVDRDSYTTKLSRDLDPNYNPSLGSNNNLTAKTTPLLTKSLQYLLGLSATEFPVSDINQFNIGTYYGHSNFDLLASDETYFADKVVTGHFACGTPAVKDFCDDCFSFKPEPGKEYILSAWVKEESVEQVKTYTNPLIKLVFYNDKHALDIEAQIISTLPIKANGDIIDGWQRVVQKFRIPTNTITIGIELENLSPSIPVYFDDIRIHPLQGSVKSFVYDPETFKLMSELDENNYSTFYEYDNEGGLVRVKKETAKGIKTIQETRSGSVITPTTTNP